MTNKNMKIKVISYSLSGNNELLASVIASELSAEHYKIEELIPSTNGKIMIDMMLNRTPEVLTQIERFDENTLILFVGPVWMGHIPAPFRYYFKQLKNEVSKYAYISLSGGVDGPNKRLYHDLKKRVGRVPESIVNILIADLLPAEQKRNREMNSQYSLNKEDALDITDCILKKLNEIL
ncbi:MAG: flavodoxin family protein [bacterium]|nr:flavodoxin family protein [bacterium]